MTQFTHETHYTILFHTYIFGWHWSSGPFLYEMQERAPDHGTVYSWGGLHGPYLQIPQRIVEEPLYMPIQL